MDNSMGTTLTPELIEKARVELNENQSQVPDQIQILREKVQKNPILNFRTDDAFLLRFLRARKFDQDKALELLKKYYRQKEDYPKIFSMSRSDVERVLNAQIQGVLSKRDPFGRAVLVITVNHWNPDSETVEEFIFGTLLSLETIIEDEAIQINGIVLIVDIKGFNSAYVKQTTPLKVKKFASIIMNSFPVRIVHIHHLNETPLHAGVMSIFKPMLSQKMQDRLLFHGDCLASLHEYLDPEIMPEDLGGDMEPIDHTEWNAKILSQFSAYSDNMKYGFVKKT